MKKELLTIAIIAILSGCTTTDNNQETSEEKVVAEKAWDEFKDEDVGGW